MLSRVLVLCAVLGFVGNLAAEDTNDYGPLPPPQQPEDNGAEAFIHFMRDAEVQPVVSVEKAPSPSDKQVELEAKLRQAAELHGEIDQLRNELGANEQILVRVQMVEVSLTELRKLGVDFAALHQGRASLQSLDQLRQAFKTTSAPRHTESNSTAANDSASIVDWLEQHRIAKVLSQPNMVVVNGRPATMFVGTELPTPTTEDTKSIQFQRCGTEVSVLAIARDQEHVRLELRARVSEPDDSRSIGVEGSSIPAMKVRECDTAVETSFGEPVIIDGIVETRVESKKSEAGADETANEVALLIVATPDHVQSTKTTDCNCPCQQHASASMLKEAKQCVSTANACANDGDSCCESCKCSCQQGSTKGAPAAFAAPIPPQAQTCPYSQHAHAVQDGSVKAASDTEGSENQVAPAISIIEDDADQSP
jgi:hypothetical protein